MRFFRYSVQKYCLQYRDRPGVLLAYVSYVHHRNSMQAVARERSLRDTFLRKRKFSSFLEEIEILSPDGYPSGGEFLAMALPFWGRYGEGCRFSVLLPIHALFKAVDENDWVTAVGAEDIDLVVIRAEAEHIHE